jgi:hypothetical protein
MKITDLKLVVYLVVASIFFITASTRNSEAAGGASTATEGTTVSSTRALAAPSVGPTSSASSTSSSIPTTSTSATTPTRPSSAAADDAPTSSTTVNQLQTSGSSSQPDDVLDLNNKPRIKLGLTESSFNLGASESMIAWERWHHAVGRAIHKRVQKATTTNMGEVVLDIHITNDCKLTAKVLSSTNSKIAESCLNATQTLDGDTILIFPVDSKRQAVHFTFEYRRGLIFFPKNHYITDDYERLSGDP